MSLSAAVTQNMNAQPLSRVADGPHSMLDQLDPLLGVTGAMRNNQDIHKLISIMKESDMMVNRCLILNILQMTKAPTTLTRFMDAGGWNVLNLWLAEAKRSQNNPLMLEILLVLQKLPVTISALKQGNMGKLVKQLSKQEHSEVKDVAADLLTKWMAIFREGQAARGKDSIPGSNGTSSGAPAENHQDRDKEREKEKAKEEKRFARKFKKEKEALRSPVEAHPPPGPLVALGRPKDKAKRPRDIVSKVSGLPPEKKSRSSSTSGAEDDKEGSFPGSVPSSAHKGGLVESESFMNALSSQAVRKVEKRVKKVSKSSGGVAKPSPTQTKPPTDFPGEKGQDGPAPTTPTSVPPPSEMVVDIQQDREEEKECDELPPTTAKTVKPKKRVSWASDPALVTIHHFELDENERVNVSRSFLDAAQQEKLMEREALSSGRAQFDTLVEMVQWHRPIVFRGTIELIKKGSESEQMNIQAEREQKVLGQLFLSKASVPPTPSEPDQDSGQMDTKPKLIPLLEPGAQEAAVVVQGPPLFSPSSVDTGAPFFPVPESPGLIPNQGFKIEDGPVGGGLAPPPAGMPEGHAMIREGPYSTDTGYCMYGPRPSGSPSPGPPGGLPPQGGPPFQYYGDGIIPMYRGRGGPLRSRGRGMRRGRGAAFLSPRMSHICKHFITHGCRLGSSCKFLHCTPEELASQMANDRTDQPNSPQH